VTTNNPLIQVQHLGKSFQDLQVLKDINVDIHKGDVVCVIGPSGSGKSTFLTMAGALQTPSSGDIIINNKEELLQVRAAAKEQIDAYNCRILVCSGTGCIATGSAKIYEEFQELTKNTPGVVLDFAPHDEGEHVGVKKTGCQGFCELGPLVRIQKGDEVIQYVKVQVEDCQEIFENTVLGSEVVERLLYSKKDVVYKHPEDIPFMAKQTRIVLENCGRVDAESLDEYIAAGGFEG